MSGTSIPPPDADAAWVATTPQSRDRRTESDALKSVGTALDLLECFAVDTQLGVSDLARRLGIAKSTTHRLLTTLASRGIIEQDAETGKYRLGLHLLELGILVQGRNEIRYAALPVMLDVSRRTGAAVNLAVPDGADVVFVERIEIGGGREILMHSGRRYPAHVTSSGKVIAAYNTELDKARCAAGFPPRSTNTIRNQMEWDRVLDDVRRRGYAASVSESFDGLSTVAVPLLSLDGVAYGSLSMLAPSHLLEGKFDQNARMLGVAAKRIMARYRAL